MTANGNILDRIVKSTRESLAKRIKDKPLPEIEVMARQSGLARDFTGALRQPGASIIAEIKRASPSKGWLNESLDPSRQAESYAAGGASAISVVTEQDFFHGSFADLEAARSAVDLPVLCKDFIITPYQVFEARAHKADAVLLIAAILDAVALKELLNTARQLGMAALVETHNAEDVAVAMSAGARIVGINNRNLADFTVDLNTSIKLRPQVPSWVPVVSESGIGRREDVVALERAKVNAVLVGESLVKSKDPAAAIRALRGL